MTSDIYEDEARFASKRQFINTFKDGYWDPCHGKRVDFDFNYKGNDYRFTVGSMYTAKPLKTASGEDAVYYVYKQIGELPDIDDENPAYILLDKYATMKDLVDDCKIGDEKFIDIMISKEMTITDMC